tara:strand:+ start:1504 stop:1860 length:357 start_codon:yes stop_codon:yes gene_type:complete
MSKQKASSFGVFLKSARENAGLTVEELGAKMEMAKSSIYRHEAGGLPPETKLPKYAEALGLEIETIERAYNKNTILNRDRDSSDPHEQIIDGYLGLVRQKYLNEEDKRVEIRAALKIF